MVVGIDKDSYPENTSPYFAIPIVYHVCGNETVVDNPNHSGIFEFLSTDTSAEITSD